MGPAWCSQLSSAGELMHRALGFGTCGETSGIVECGGASQRFGFTFVHVSRAHLFTPPSTAMLVLLPTPREFAGCKCRP